MAANDADHLRATSDLLSEAADMLSMPERGFEAGGGGVYRHCSLCKAGLLANRAQHEDDCELARLVQRLRDHASRLRHAGPV